MRPSGLMVACALVVVLASATACSQGPRPQAPVASPAVEVERETFSAGSTITMRNGLALTVPAGWQGVLKTSMSDETNVLGVLGRPIATQNLRLRRTNGTGRLMHISISSCRGSEAGESGLTFVAEMGAVSLFRTGDTDADAPTLLVAETQLPGAQYGAILFRGEADDGEAAVEEVLRLLQIDTELLTGARTAVYRTPPVPNSEGT